MWVPWSYSLYVVNVKFNISFYIQTNIAPPPKQVKWIPRLKSTLLAYIDKVYQCNVSYEDSNPCHQITYG